MASSPGGLYEPLNPAGHIFFRPATLEDLDRVTLLEAAGFPADEAASRESLRFRLAEAAGCFLVAVRDRDGEDAVIGYICGTMTSEPFTHDTMSKHDPDGNTLWIHSVCVEESERRRGVASRLLKAYYPFVSAQNPTVQRLCLISKENMVPLYRKAGFEVVGPSSVLHGKDSWIEMKRELEDERDMKIWTDGAETLADGDVDVDVDRAQTVTG